MYRDFPERFAEETDGPPPSESWLFAQAILGKPIRRVLNSEARVAEPEARRQRELLEWAAQFSTECESKLRTLLSEEAEAREGLRRAELFAESLLEGAWDPSKHPRLGGPPNPGWWATTSGAGGIGGAILGAQSPFRTTLIRADQSTAHTVAATDISFPKVAALPAASPHAPSKGAAPHKSHNEENGSPKGGGLRHDDVLTYFKLLYGEKGQQLLKAFEKSGGLLKIESPWWGKSAFDTRNIWRPHQIRLHRDLNPIEAAQELMERLIEATGLKEVRNYLDHFGFENIETLKDSYRQSVKQAAATVALASELYLSGISIASEGADWVITIHDLSEGNYYAAIGLLPLLPASVGKTGVVLKHGRQSLRISAEAVRGAKALPVKELIELLESTRKLARNMEKSGIARPAGTAAHHIVPAALERLPFAKECKAILIKFGIGVENAANGVYLPAKFDASVKAAYHGSIHSKAYYRELYARLKAARSKEEVLLSLNQIRKELLAGTFPY